MIEGIDISQVTATQVVLSIIFGALIGLLLGLVGGGGSILTVPILVYVIGLEVQVATATSLAIVGTSALAGAIPHARAGRVNFRVAVFFGAFGVGGAFAGSWLNHQVSGTWILLLFGLLMLVVAARMWFRKGAGRRETPDDDASDAIGWKVPLAGLLVGVMTGFFGVGGGFLIVPALALALGVPMSVAIGTSLAIIAINSASGLVAHAGSGAFDLPIAALFIAGGLAGGLMGGRLAGLVDDRMLSRGFALLVAVVGVYLMVRNGLVVVSGRA
jgi:uncharacterized membrane protein YfcA